MLVKVSLRDDSVGMAEAIYIGPSEEDYKKGFSKNYCCIAFAIALTRDEYHRPYYNQISILPEKLLAHVENEVKQGKIPDLTQPTLKKLAL